MPTLQNLYDLLCQQTEPEAKRLATALEIYVSGSLNIFNHKTNVDYRNARVVCFDLKKLGAGLRTIAMHIINDLMNSQVSHNFARGIATWCYLKPLTDKQMDDYELRPAPGNPDRATRPSITAQLKEAARRPELPKEPDKTKHNKSHEDR